MRLKLNQLGFSLIEILVAIAIIITATTVVVAILSSSFRGISKSNVVEEVRQNGNRAITQMSRTIQFAESFQGAFINDSTYDLACTASAGKNYEYIKLNSGGRLVTLSCNNLSMGSTTVTPLIDTTRVSVVEGSCSFTCTQQSVDDSPIIGINFELSQAGETAPEKSAKIPFSTTVKMRNR
ncbi:MAG: prepilin-type N-terminal cleavage/methylation domain-containing protein [Candidatus Levybacteria bacterium]|nr:prepilin-type N-terminal cleavage/methylation domain-containing protein [Candidatus Levybacteria bacterium]